MKQAQREKLFTDIFVRDGGCCAYCGTPVRPRRRGLHGASDLATLDHVTPRAMGGSTVAENLVLACQACNNARGTTSADAFRAKVKGR